MVVLHQLIGVVARGFPRPLEFFAQLPCVPPGVRVDVDPRQTLQAACPANPSCPRPVECASECLL
eukprot:5667843-Pyramimonas_sp.AAC.1